MCNAESSLDAAVLGQALGRDQASPFPRSSHPSPTRQALAEGAWQAEERRCPAVLPLLHLPRAAWHHWAQGKRASEARMAHEGLLLFPTYSPAGMHITRGCPGPGPIVGTARS